MKMGNLPYNGQAIRFYGESRSENAKRNIHSSCLKKTPLLTSCHMTIWCTFVAIKYAFVKKTYKMVGIHMQHSPHLNINIQLCKHQFISLEVNSVIKHGIKRQPKCFSFLQFKQKRPYLMGHRVFPPNVTCQQLSDTNL